LTKPLLLFNNTRVHKQFNTNKIWLYLMGSTEWVFVLLFSFDGPATQLASGTTCFCMLHCD